jgi:3-carboxy-cis,cis-muconate cycloisomerase
MSDGLNSFLFSTPEMSRVLSPQEQLRAMMRFEWALTCALEKQGLAEVGSGAVLHALLDAHFVDIDAMESEAKQVGNISIPFVRQLTAAVRARDERASRAIHLGATSQDLVDTALVLQMSDAVALLQAAMKSLDASLARQVQTHRETVLSGRTWLQPGPPTTLGLKLAGTLAALRRSHDRIRSAAHRALVLQFGGAVGTLAALGDSGSAVSKDLARLLDLREPELPWHTQRDNLVEMVQALALLTGSLAKLARDIALLMQAEVGEASEGTDNERGGSSTMPHKHNPVACGAVLAAHAKMPGLVQTLLHAMPQEHERGLGSWQAEWDIVPEAFRLTAAALQYSMEIANGLAVNPERMQANLDALLGVTLSEAVSAALAPKVGRSAAHDILRDAVRRAKQERRRLGDALKQTPEVSAHLSDHEIDRLLNSRAYLGSAQRFITRVLQERHEYD